MIHNDNYLRQSSKKDEDGPNTHVLYSQSEGGINWGEFKSVLNKAGTSLKGVIEQDLKA
ncbi:MULTISPECIES: hypothetical protein [unclassified Pseudoalteromonas]|uniref:hypothetical protein n=1 Tax=unclassified Pseudoalteromonas TaxID=194690 RepID=UPI0015FEE80D|nr:MULTISPECIES: hypothetical protein [unclassified Pseudoalteromonas]MBB1332130.1 hypothetical protein [Pseudoalteromonas sp. SR41-6]MBB1457388.1 hypothetical protein [Pseudoalteromonas sp. SG41-8]MBB1470585.1 hypothetical protein [Pseudoalteromonas sp. SG41-5]